ncbi:MAG: DNA/RNA nuclease SfsA [Proteobacteria bacterium]|nr:DNA/RNA nuclease SfsA [Pseudomonadota bacterium]
MKLFNTIEKATFLSRPNRFILVCDLKGRRIKAYLPNPGRLWELLLPKVTVYLEKSENKEGQLPYTVVAVEGKGHPVMLHTHKTNDAVQSLIEKGLAPGLEGYSIVKREYTVGRSRFDFLLQKGPHEILLEVKSCSLFSKKVAMFPDAITDRGKRHIEELAHLSNEKRSTMVLFLVNSPDVDFFLPEYHTDLKFAQTLLASRRAVKIMPLAVKWNDDLSMSADVKQLEIPWHIVEKEAHDKGSYLIILRLDEDCSIEIGALGMIAFKKGYYIYVGSAMIALTKRIERHKRLRKQMHWHIDYFRAKAGFHAALPIRSHSNMECEIAAGIKEISKGEIKGFGASDCNCASHLYVMNEDPLSLEKFHDFLQYYRMDRLFECAEDF